MSSSSRRRRIDRRHRSTTRQALQQAPCEGRDKKENTGLEQHCSSSGDTTVLEGRRVSVEHDVHTIITPFAIVGGGANLNVDEVAEKHGEGDDDEVESKGHRRANRHGMGNGSSCA
jgi:hypothetical protein